MANESLPRNVVFFGEAGVGKTSVITMIAGSEATKYNNNYCDADIDGALFRLWETPSDEGSTGWGDNAVVNLCRVIQSMQGVVSLFVYCIRGPRIKDTTAENYRMFYSMFSRSDVPIVLVVTGLEEEEPMDEWWQTNKVAFHRHKMIFASYACVTGTKGKLKGEKYTYEEEYAESTKRLRNLIADPNLNNPRTTTSPKAVIKNLRKSAVSVLKPKRKQPGEIEEINAEGNADDKRSLAKGEPGADDESETGKTESKRVEKGRTQEDEDEGPGPEKGADVDAKAEGDGDAKKGNRMKIFRAKIFKQKPKESEERSKETERRNVGSRADGQGADENAVDGVQTPDESGEEVRSVGGNVGSIKGGAAKMGKTKKLRESATSVFKSKSKQQPNESKEAQVEGQSNNKNDQEEGRGESKVAPNEVNSDQVKDDGDGPGTPSTSEVGSEKGTNGNTKGNRMRQMIKRIVPGRKTSDPAQNSSSVV